MSLNDLLNNVLKVEAKIVIVWKKI